MNKRKLDLEPLDEQLGIEVSVNPGKSRVESGDYQYIARGGLYLLATQELIEPTEAYGDTQDEATDSVRGALKYYADEWRKKNLPAKFK